MCYGCNGCDRCGKITRMRELHGRRFCPKCHVEVNHIAKECDECGAQLPPLSAKPGESNARLGEDPAS